MSYQIVLTPFANDDFLNSLEWYSNQQDGLEKRFYNTITETIRLIAENPHLFAVRKKTIRAAIVGKFPFLIFYKIEEARQRVVVLAILHQSRDPKIWMNR